MIALLLLTLLLSGAVVSEAIGWRYLGTHELGPYDCVLFRRYDKGYLEVEVRKWCGQSQAISFHGFPPGRLKLLGEGESFTGGLEIILVYGEGSIPVFGGPRKFSLYFKPEDPTWAFDRYVKRVMSWANPRELIRDLRIMTLELIEPILIASLMIWVAVRSNNPAVIAVGALATVIIATTLFGLDIRFILVLSAVLLAYGLYRVLWRGF